MSLHLIPNNVARQASLPFSRWGRRRIGELRYLPQLTHSALTLLALPFPQPLLCQEPQIPLVDWMVLPSILGLPGGASGKEPGCPCRRHKRCGFSPSVRKIPWRRAWQPTPVFLPGESLDRGAWQGMVHKITKSQIRLKQLSTDPLI